MKFPCDLIKDILPLYYDKVCSDESKKIVEQHLSECDSCNKYYNQMYTEDCCQTNIYNQEIENQKAKSFVCVKNKILQKQILVTSIVIGFIVIACFVTITALKSSTNIIEYADNITVSIEDDNLVAHLKGSQANYLKIKNVFFKDGNTEKSCLFFYMTDTKWDEITTSSKMFSEYVLCPFDKGIDNVYEVYYYTGDYANIESLSDIELNNIKDKSIKLWSK